MLLDAYHMERSGAGGRGFDGVAPEEIAAFQYSDAPPAPVAAGVKRPTDRLPPGKGVVRWLEVFKLLKEKSFDGLPELRSAQPGAMGSARRSTSAAKAVAATRALIAKALELDREEAEPHATAPA